MTIGIIAAEESLAKLAAWVESEDFKGYDPYDALNSPFLRALSLQLKYPGIAFTQALRRLPVNLRPLLGIAKEHNPKGIGLFLRGYARLYSIERRAAHLETIESLLDILASGTSPGYSGSCWGYNFPWQSRAFLLPRWTPTIVNSSFIGHSLLEAWRLAGSERALAMALPIRHFILRDLHRTGDEHAFCFSYSPLDRAVVHNASLLGASLLLRLHRHCRDEEAKSAGLAALRWSIDRQKPDGSWVYAETDYQGWIDSFHTGFNLEAIGYAVTEGCDDGARAAWEKGRDFYRERFFGADGRPYYYHDGSGAIDIHSPAEGVAFFSSAGHLEFAGKLLEWMVRNMQDRKGYFYFRKGRYLTNRIPYMRWSQSWAFNALTAWLHAVKSAGREGTMP